MELFMHDRSRLSESNFVVLLHVLNHVPLTHPPVGADAMASRIRALIRRRMLLLEMDFHELLSLKVGLIATFEGARMPSGLVGVRFLGISVDVMVVPYMLTKVILALESIVSPISRMKTDNSQPRLPLTRKGSSMYV
jgi:hypothetical protein